MSPHTIWEKGQRVISGPVIDARSHWTEIILLWAGSYTRNRGISPSSYYSEDSDLDSALMMSRVTLNVSIGEEHRMGGTYNQHINRKVTLPKLNNESSTNDQWTWLADVRRYIDSGCSMSILESEINKSLSNGFWGVWF